MITLGRSLRSGVCVASFASALLMSCAGTLAAAERGYSQSFGDFRQRLETPGTRQNSSADPDALPGIVLSDGTRFIAEGAVGVGYDSNIDYRVNGTADGGVYGMTDLGMALISGPQSAQTTVVVRGGYGYHDIDKRPDRWDVGVLIDHYRQINSEVSWDFGGFFLHDDIDVDQNERSAGYSQFNYNSGTTEAFARTRVMYSDYLAPLNSNNPATLFFPRDSTFDNLRIEQSVGALLLKDRRLAPFFEVGYANLDYNHELNPAVFSRDADEIWAIGGVRVTIAPTLHIDLGARYNQRWFEGPTPIASDSVDSWFFDGKLVWTPSDWLYVEANIDRQFLEPIVDQALMTDSTTYSLTTNMRIDNRTRLKLEGGHITEEEVGTPDTFRHWYGEARLTREIAERTELFASVIGYHTRNEASDLEANRVDTLVGIRIHN